MITEARDTMLRRIREALNRSGPADPELAATDWGKIQRSYEREGRRSTIAKLELLEERLRDYDAEVHRVFAAEVPGAIASLLAARADHPTLLPQGFPAEWIPAGVPFTTDPGFSPRKLDRFGRVVTAAGLAIAETGTLVLQSVPGQGRRAATLVPDFHLCVIRAEDVVETVPEAFARLAPTSALATTFISGPSATSDIEMTRIKGVHGPRSLSVLLVLDPPA